MDRTRHDPPAVAGLPAETAAGPRFVAAVAATLRCLIVAPGRSFRHVPSAIDHGRVLGFLVTLRLPLWALLLVLLLTRALGEAEPELWRMTAIGQILDVELVEALSLWLLLLVPLGVPVLYFAVGILAHVALGLTGGGRQSIGATMRAFGYSVGPALLVVSVLDLGLHLGGFDGLSVAELEGPELYAIALAVVLAGHYGLLSIALAATHRIGLFRALSTAALPVLVFGALSFGRAALELERFPFVPAPQPDPFLPVVFE